MGKLQIRADRAGHRTASGNSESFAEGSLARLIPAGFCVSVQKSAPAGKIEVHLSDKQWKKFVVHN
jgi:hypothetical protein